MPITAELICVVIAMWYLKTKQPTNLFTHSTNQHTIHWNFHPPNRLNLPNQAHANKPRQPFILMRCSKTRETKGHWYYFSSCCTLVRKRDDNHLSFDHGTSHWYSGRSYGSECSYCCGCGYDYGRREHLLLQMPQPENDGEWNTWCRCNVFRAPRRGFRSVVATAALMTTLPPQQTSLRWCQYDDTPRHWCTHFIITSLTVVTVHFQSTSYYDAACSSMTADIFTWKRHFSAKRRRRNTHFASHRSSPCGKAPHVGHHQFRFFRTTCGSGVATGHAGTPNHNDGAEYLSTADDCRTKCRAQPPWEPVVLEWSQHGREMVMVVSILSLF